MTRLSERIAADVLKASGSGLQNYTMNGSRERIIEAASVADDLLEALQDILKVRVDREDNIWAGANRCKDIAREAITKATGAAS